MRVLIVMPNVPATPRAAGSPRVYDLARGLRARGHSPGLVCAVQDEARWEEFLHVDGGADIFEARYLLKRAPRLSRTGRVLNLISPLPAFHTQLRARGFFAEMCALVDAAIREFRPDVLNVDQLSMVPYVPTSWRGALVVDAHDAISLTETRRVDLDGKRRGRRYTALMRYQIRKIRRYERLVAERADAYIVNAEPDRAYLQAFVPGGKVFAFPNDVDTTFYAPAPNARMEGQLVFTGTFSYFFNTDAMTHFHAKVLPLIRAELPEVRLKMVGADPQPELLAIAERDPLTSVTGYVEDVRPLIWESAVVICPLRGGTGMKNKLLNAMAMGKPIVATPISADGIGVRDGEQMLLAEGDAEFAKAVVRVMRDRALAERLGNSAREFVVREFGYPRLAMRYEALCEEILNRRTAMSGRVVGERAVNG